MNAPQRRPRVAIAIGDPAGIGPEVALKAARDARVLEACAPVVVGDPDVLIRYAGGEGLDGIALHKIQKTPLPDLVPGAMTADGGRAILEYAGAALDLALSGDADAVVACPQTQKAIEMAGIAFDGYPSFVARHTGTDPDRVFLMLVGDRMRIAHVTLHLGIRAALELIEPDRIRNAVASTQDTLIRLGIDAPRIAVSGVNPHAGEDGLFGSEEIEIIGPALDALRDDGMLVDGPFGADTMYLDESYDAYVVMLHDQGHIPAKLMARDSTSAFAMGTPVLFSSVAHGSAYDIAGKGIANPEAVVRTILRVAGVADASD